VLWSFCYYRSCPSCKFTVKYLINKQLTQLQAATTAASKAAATGSASSSTAVAGGSVLTAQAYNDISISGGTSGNAEAEANALFSSVPSDLSTVSAADLKIIAGTHDVAEDAEVDAFNPAIDAAGGASSATALQVLIPFPTSLENMANEEIRTVK